MTLPRVKVRELAEQIRGVSYGKQDASDSPKAGYLPVLRAGNISDDGLVFDDLVFVPAERISEKQKIRRHDVVIATSSGSLEVVGKAAPALQDFEGGFGAFCKVLRPGNKIIPNYFAHFFKTQYYRQRVSALAAGANINNLRNEHLDDFEIPLPSLAEQRRIAEILDKGDELRAKRRRAFAQLDILSQSIFLDMFGDPACNQKNLPRKPLGELIRVRSGEPVLVSELAKSGQYPVYGGNGINGYHSRFMFDTPKIVIGRVGVYCGVVHITQQYSWVTDNALYVSEISPDLDLRYLAQALTLANLNQHAGRFAQPLVSGSRIYPVEILIPRMSLQNEFAKRITNLEKLRAVHNDSLAELDALFVSLQHRAFRGEL